MQENEENLEKEIRGIYTPLSVARKEIQRRWNDKELRKKVEAFLGGDIPKVLKNGPRAVLARHVTTPNLEFSHFIELASLLKLSPVNLEYLEDKYLSCNPAKFYLGKLCFFKRYEQNGKGTINHEYIIDFKNSENKPLSKIRTLRKKSLVDFHHQILKSSKIDVDIFDISKWYKKRGGRAREYMKYYLALFICNGVLFENYLTQKNEGEFTTNIVLPAFREIHDFFGLKPLVIPIMPSTEADEVYWWAYPDNLKDGVSNLK